ncbi:restriction endonuclease subunit S [Mycobacterium heidelbergense]|uniref:Uncharacterized protein n=1 Tax=Mycobacterium heidelbergense TaxID=53376 RepID=A0A1X0DGS3_MYCHE|nr:restriction endonuclease subunit S [Mycobacterium heidelbergense]MCV7051664.1 restriction endonuclease subunit S [Mycobacterium heidelbergense]ORA71392.1 hypothetical protein BST25_16820 [Mycobacterium heidelbergense]BBZ50350.1 hypothetical protein MHEI_20670 [Mycobacterium heidelbergense]
MIVAIGDVTERVHTWNPAAQPDSEFLYVDLGAVDSASKSITDAVRVRGSDAPSRARQLVQSGDVLVSTVRPNLNAVAAVDVSLDGATASTGFTVLRPSHRVHSRYLYHWVRTPAFVAEMVRKSTGANYPAVSDRIVKESTLALPGLNEQRRIAAILDHCDSLCFVGKKVLSRLHVLRQSAVAHFVDSVHGTERNLSDLVDAGDRLNYGVVQPGETVKNGVPLVRVSDLRLRRIDRTALKLIGPDIDRTHSHSRLRGTEVLVVCVGMTIGKIAIAQAVDIGSNIARAIARIPISDSNLRTFVAAYLETEAVQSYFKASLRTVAQPTLNIKQLGEARIKVPSIGDLANLCARLESIDAQSQRARCRLEALQRMSVSLQSRAFSGQL